MNMKCAWCGKDFVLRNAEYNRAIKMGRHYFFCSLSCVARYRNISNPCRRRPVIKTCPVCNKEFGAMTGSKSATFCSRSCASRGSITGKRRRTAKRVGLANARNMNTAEAKAASLRSREWWKYNDLAIVLGAIGESHTFEFPIKVDEHIYYVFDLALHSRKILVEFDGEYHRYSKEQDTQKDKIAQEQGWRVLRVLVPGGHPIPMKVIKNILV